MESSDDPDDELLHTITLEYTAIRISPGAYHHMSMRIPATHHSLPSCKH